MQKSVVSYYLIVKSLSNSFTYTNERNSCLLTSDSARSSDRYTVTPSYGLLSSIARNMRKVVLSRAFVKTLATCKAVPTQFGSEKRLRF